METRLRRALERNEFVLHYQPVIDEAGQVLGAEALVRWNHPQRGMVPPGDFIPLAEQTSLILPLGRQVLAMACTQLAQWAAAPRTAGWSVAVNVSAQQFRQADFVQEVLGVLRDCGADPRQLKLELTESLLLDQVDSAIARMHELRALGLGFSLDDFGTGFSSLSYLRRLPLEQLKIDRSFVVDLLTDANAASIARAVIHLAHSLGLSVVAEGVESEDVWSHLREQGCDAAQGYLFSRPVPADEIPQRLRELAARAAL